MNNIHPVAEDEGFEPPRLLHLLFSRQVPYRFGDNLPLLVHRVGFEPTMFTTRVPVLQTGAFSILPPVHICQDNWIRTNTIYAQGICADR